MSSKGEPKTLEKTSSRKQAILPPVAGNAATGSVAERRKKRTSVKPQDSSARRERDGEKQNGKRKKDKEDDVPVEEDLSVEEEPEYVPDPKESSYIDHLVEEPVVNLLCQLSLIRQKRWKTIPTENNDAEMLKIVKTIICPELGNLIAYLESYKEIRPTHLLADPCVKGVLSAEALLNRAQDQIRSTLKQGLPVVNLVVARNQARAKFIEAGTKFYEWMNEKVELDNLENQYRNVLSHIEAEVALSRSNNFDFVGASIPAANSFVSQDRVFLEVGKASESFAEWKGNYASYLRKAALNTEEKARVVGQVFNSLQACFSETATIDDDQATALFTAEKMRSLSEGINEEYKVMNDSNPTNTFPKTVIVDAIGYIIRDFKVAMQEIEELREIEKRLAIVLNEVNDWVEVPNVEESRPYQTYIAKRVASNALKKEVAFLEFQMKDLQSPDQFYADEGTEAESKKKLDELKENTRKKKEQLRLTNKEAEFALKELSKIAQVHFPELPVVNPKLDLVKFIASDELLLENRSLGDYTSIELIKGERNQIYKVLLETTLHILKEFTFIKTEDDRNTMIVQAKLVNRLQHPNLCDIEAIFFNRTENYAYIQMPFFSEGNLLQWQKNTLPDHNLLRHLLRGILRGLAYIHHNGVVHCNVCPSRIVVEKNTKSEDVDDSERFIAKILPWALTKSNEERCVHSSAIAKSKLVGNIPEYVAPELAMGELATMASDMYALGLVMYDLFFVFKEAPGGPSTTRPTFLESMKNEGKIEIPTKSKDPHLVNLLMSLLNPAPGQRLTARDSLDHPFFATNLDRPTEKSIAELSAWRNTEDKVVKHEEILLLNERQAFFQRTSKLHAIQHKLGVLFNAHRLQQLNAQQEWAKKPNEAQKHELRKERLSLERKEVRLAEKMRTLEEEKLKWRKRFYLSVSSIRQVRAKWVAISSTEVQAISKPPQEWLTSNLFNKFTLFRVNITDQLREQISKLSGLSVISVERVENTQLWQHYVQCRETLAKFGTRKAVSVSTNEPWVHSQLHLCNYVNEVLLWHPLRGESDLDLLITQGFQLRLDDLRGAYGYGVYFWESIEAILSEVTANEEGVAYFILSRVCLGTPFFAAKPLYGINSPPFAIEEKEKEKPPKKGKKDKAKDKVQEEDKEKDPEEQAEPERKEVVVDSVVARIKPYKQFVVYDRTQAYPQFVVGVQLPIPKSPEKSSARGVQLDDSLEEEQDTFSKDDD